MSLGGPPVTLSPQRGGGLRLGGGVDGDGDAVKLDEVGCDNGCLISRPKTFSPEFFIGPKKTSSANLVQKLFLCLGIR